VAAVRVSIEFAVLAAVAVFHFFLFCNVFRLSRPLELLWSAWFLACVGLRVLAGVPWFVVAAAVAAATTLVICRELRKESYHGVLWRWLNPELPAWWAGRLDAATEHRAAASNEMHDER
jgi:hypothetical protein